MYFNTYQKAFLKVEDEFIPLLPEDAQPPYTIIGTTITNNNMIYFVTDYQSEQAYLVRYDLASRQSETVLSFIDESITVVFLG